MSIHYYMVIVISLIFAGCNQQNNRSAEPLGAQLQASIDRVMEHSDAVGVSVAVVSPDGTLWKCAGGTSHKGVPIATDMLFDIGSVEKNLQAALVLKLVEEHILALDDRVDKWLPPYRNIPGGITLRQIMNLTSGIDKFVDDPNSPWRIGYENIDYEKKWTWEEIQDQFIGEPRFAPGTRCEYSTTNYIVLKLIVEAATQSKQTTELKDRLLTPNHLDHTLVNFLDPIPERFPIAHAWLDPGGGQLKDITGNSLNWLATLSPMLVYSTAGNLAAWMDALYHKKTVLREETLGEMLDFKGPVQDEPMMYGYGLGTADIDLGALNPKWAGLRAYGHLGSQYGYTTFAAYFPELELSLVMMFNRGADRSTMDAVMPMADAIMDVLLRYFGVKESDRKGSVSGMLEELDKNPKDVHLMYRIAKAYQENKDDYEASLMYKEILKDDPDDEYGYKVEALFWDASYEGVIHKNPESLIAFIAEHGDYKDIRDAYKWLAKTYKRRGEMDSAVQVYMDALEVFAGDAEFYNHFAWWVYENKLEKRYDVAIEYAKSAVELNPEAWYIWDTLAWLYHEKGQGEEAVKAAGKALSLAPESAREECRQSLRTMERRNK